MQIKCAYLLLKFGGNSGLNNSVKHSVIRIATYLQLNQQYIEMADMVHFPLHFGPL